MWLRRAVSALLAIAFFAAPATAADWRTTLGVFRIGLVGGPGAPTLAGRDRVKAAFAAALSMPVEMVLVRDQADLIDAHASTRIDYAIYSAVGYATAWRLCSCVQPLVAPTGADGSTGVRSVLIVRAGDTEDDLEGRKIAAGPDDLARSMIGGWRTPSQGEAAPSVEIASSMGEAEQSLLDGKVAGLFGWELDGGDDEPSSGTLSRLSNLSASDAFAVLRRSDAVRYGPHAVRLTLDPQARRLLVDFLTGLLEADREVYDLLEERLGGGFAAVTHADYTSATRIVDAVIAETGEP